MPVDPPFLGRGRAHGPDLHKVQIRDGLWPPRCHVFSNSGHSLPVLSSSAGTQREKKEVGAGGGGEKEKEKGEKKKKKREEEKEKNHSTVEMCASLMNLC